MKVYDVAVAGAGVFGAWTALHLRRRGHSVALADPYGPGNSRSSSGGESRILRLGYGPDEIYTRMAQRSFAQWREFSVFVNTGVLWTAPAGDPYANATRKVLTRCGVPFLTLLPSDLSARFPQLSLHVDRHGIYEPDSGVLMARRAVQTVAAEAVRLGVEYVNGAVDSVSAGSYVYACGPWLPKVFPELLDGLITPTRQEVFFFGVPAGDARFAASAMPVWLDFSEECYAYTLPDLEHRGFKLAFDQHGRAFDPDCGDRSVASKSIERARQYLASHFPALSDAPLLEARVCQYENTSNGDFLIDRHPGMNNVWIAGGGSGHGFKHGPAVGEYVAGLIEGTATAEPRFSLAAKSRERRRAVH